MRSFLPASPAVRWCTLSGACLAILLTVFSFRGNPPKVLVFSRPGDNQPAHLERLRKASGDLGFALDTAVGTARFTEDSLRQYRAVVFLHLSPQALDDRQRADLERYVQAGGGIMVVNAATDTVRNWPWYEVLNRSRLAAAQTSWPTKFGGGRAYFTQLPADVPPEALEKRLGKGLKFVAGKSVPDYARATTGRAPEPSRFVTEVLDTYQYEPMEMVIFPDGRVLYIERRGDVKLYDPARKKSRVIAHFEVSITGNYEDGMLGVALDPNYERNHWIYVNYSPAGSVPKQNVSRFELIGDSLVMTSEKIVFEIPTQRETCCHSGGHLEFGPNGDLYLSTGDNTSSKESSGFTPIDERPGRAPFDAQKSSGNTHDLRGKILRIHPEPDGTYSVPDGNLFPKDGSLGKPEIYVMGTRNAFRFSVDDRTGYVYWGDVGPDGGITNQRGPQSHDEFNQAKKPGNYGWPYFVADNQAYADFDFATNAIGARFNAERPENTSPNNTGAKVLPPAQKPMIWYPYGESREFPSLGKGSRSAMAGPVYHAEDYPAATRFPDYYDGKLFIYEWARSWVKLVSFDKNDDLARIEPFLPDQEWYKPIDMKFGPDGSLYVLQYGANYFEHNPDARLVKITYQKGNRRPVARLTADQTVGAAPLTVALSAEKSFDYDPNDPLSYAWNVGEAGRNGNGNVRTTVTYTQPGVYRPTVTVTDREGQQTTAGLEIRVGNERPRVAVGLGGANRSFYYDNQKLDYQVTVSDKEDGTQTEGIDSTAVFVSFDYLKEGKDLALLASNAQLTGGMKFLQGKNLVDNSDCRSCHHVSERSIGPSYVAVAERYQGKRVVDTLADKILKGGNGNWGKNVMAAHPQHTKKQAADMVKYILSLSDPQNVALPLRGRLTATEHVRTRTAGSYVIRASYTDRGNPVTGTLTGSSLLVLRHPKVQAEDFELHRNVGRRHVDGTNFSYVGHAREGSYIGFKNVDLTAIQRIRFRANAPAAGTRIEIRADAPDGPLVGTTEIAQATATNSEEAMQVATASVTSSGGAHDLYLVFRNPNQAENDILNLDWVYFDNGGLD